MVWACNLERADNCVGLKTLKVSGENDNKASGDNELIASVLKLANCVLFIPPLNKMNL